MIHPKLNDFLCNLQTLFLQTGRIPYVLKLQTLKTGKMPDDSKQLEKNPHFPVFEDNIQKENKEAVETLLAAKLSPTTSRSVLVK